MKALYITLLVLIVGCQTKSNEKIQTDESINKIDSILNQSQQTFAASSKASAKSDSTINEKVEKTVKQISTLKTEVKQLKEENNALKVKLSDTVNDSKPFKLLPVSSDQNNR